MIRNFDTVIKGGTIIDGARTPRFVSDIGIRDGRVAYIGDIANPGQAEVIDAKGLIVAPGSIDLHTHYDSQIFWDPYCTLSGWHGVTSVVIGNCGFGFAPCKPEERDRAMLTMERNEAVPLKTMKAGMPWDWVSFPEFLDSVDRTPKGVNLLSYVPLSPLLIYVMGIEAAKSRPATEAERAELRRLFIEALDAGACGFSAQRKKGNVQRDYDGSLMVTDAMAHEDLLMFAEILRERGEGFMQMLSFPDLAEELAKVSGRPVVWNTLVAQFDQHGVAIGSQEEAIAWLKAANDRGTCSIRARSGSRRRSATMTRNCASSPIRTFAAGSARSMIRATGRSSAAVPARASRGGAASRPCSSSASTPTNIANSRGSISASFPRRRANIRSTPSSICASTRTCARNSRARRSCRTP
jgi:N-acyl-D-amino-acid deacylase